MLPLGGATCIRKRHNLLVINRKSYDRCGRLAKVCIWKFQVSFFCTAASARYFDTYVCRLAATSASSTQSKLWQPEKVSPRLSGTFVGGGKRRRRGAGSWAKQPLSPAHDASSAQKGPAGLQAGQEEGAQRWWRSLITIISRGGGAHFPVSVFPIIDPWPNHQHVER